MPDPVSPRRLALLAAVFVMLLAGGACGRSADDDRAAAPDDGRAAPGTGDTETVDNIAIKDFAFSPATAKVAVGTEITWTNGDSAAHTVTATDKSFDSGSLAENATFVHKFDSAGTFEYFCTFHNYMKGTVTVE